MLTLTFAAGGTPPVNGEGRLVHAWSAETGEVYATAHADGDRRWIDWPGLAIFAFSTTAPHVTAWAAPGAARDAVTSTFFRVLQPVVLQAIGWQALHASAVAIGDRVVALCGRSGAGKSTLAYALGRQWDQWADDAVVIERGAQVVAIELPFTPRLRPPARRHFHGGAAGPIDRREAKRRPLAAVIVLEQDEALAESPQYRRVPPAEAFQLLVTHAHCFDHTDPIEARRLVSDYLAIADVVPVYALTYRPGFDELPALMRLVSELVSPEQPMEGARAVCAGG